jgi:predicted dehydrogenase
MEEVTVALVSMGGYAYNFYGTRLLQQPNEFNIKFVGGVSRSPRNVNEAYKRSGIPVYSSLDDFYEADWAELVIVSGPIHKHAPVTCKALTHGSNVLCEKPLAGTVQEAEMMAEAEKKSGKFVAIGYQWSFSNTIQELKQDILNDFFGKPVRLKMMLLWPRTLSYYNRNDWAGRIMSPEGEWILDSPVQNATAHYLHNMLYILGDSRETSAQPVEIEAELYRANEIENYDAAALRCKTENGAEILYYTAHCVPENKGIILSYKFEKASVEYNTVKKDCFTARFKDGHIKNYGNPGDEDENKLRDSIRAVRMKEPVACGISASTPHLLCVNGAQESSSIKTFPREMVNVSRYNNSELVWVKELSDAFQKSYKEEVLPTESKRYSWASQCRKIDLQNYACFPSFKDV